MTAAQKMGKVLKALIISYTITAVLLFVIAVVVYKVGISGSILSGLIAAVYIIATFVGGVITGKAVSEKRFIWGAVFGLMYIAVSLIVSSLMGENAGEDVLSCVTRCIMCVAGGMLGAMLS